MTPEAKGALAKAIRGGSGEASGGLRQRLLEDLHHATEAVYRLGVTRPQDAGLDEAAAARRARLDGWMREQVRAQPPGKQRRTADDFRRDAEQQAAYTWLNRIVVLRLMEESGLRAPAVVRGGSKSPGYQDFRDVAQALVREDETEGYGFLLGLIFEDLARELPGIFGPGGVADLVPMPAATLRHLVETLDAEALTSCWTDDMTLGWVYQYWNDPEREALDAKLNGGGKVQRHEIASKTQMFTERYMVDWLLHNSLGPMWLAMCRKHGWTADIECGDDGTSCLSGLEARRAAWRAQRAKGEVQLTALMPLESPLERRWAYYVPQPIPDDAVARAPESVRDLKLLDPAVGSGHFLVVAFDLLVALYREEARHRGEAGEAPWTDAAVVERILEHNLHGIDLDPRAVQIAAAALWLKAKGVCAEARPSRLNLVAANLRLSSLPDDDPALVELRAVVERETGIPAALTDTLIGALKGADHLGSLLKVDAAVDAALKAHEGALGAVEAQQGGLFSGFEPQQLRMEIDHPAARASILEALEGFLDRCTRGEDLGLRLRGRQLAAGVRFVRMVREGTYDLVVANPPYQGTSKMADSGYVERTYPLGKADLYAAFLLRGLELVREGGLAAQVSMNGWMFIKQYAALRKRVFSNHSLRSVVDLLWCAFEQMRHNTVAMYCVQRGKAPGADSVGLVPTPRDEREESIPALRRKRAATLCHEGRHTFDPAALKVVPEWPLIYWWDPRQLDLYRSAGLIKDIAPARFGVTTGDNDRFCRRSWEASVGTPSAGAAPFVPLVHGAKGERWFDSSGWLIEWRSNGIQVKLKSECQYGTISKQVRNTDYYFIVGLAFSAIGAEFGVRVHRRPSVFSNTGLSLFPADLASVLASLNTSRAVRTAGDLAPGIRFDVGDVNRLPLFPVESAGAIFSRIEAAFEFHESHREPSVEFTHPGPSPWRHAQDWAQLAVDRPEGTPLPDYTEQLDPAPATNHVSFALGVALGRFGPNREGILDPTTADITHALPHGLLFLDATLDATDHRDGLGHPAAAPLLAAWATHAEHIATKRPLREYLALEFFKAVHRSMYENRPIHWPLSSAKKTFVAWVNIHRFTEQTLRVLLADHLVPTLARVEGELVDLRAARDGADKAAARAAEKRIARVLAARDELRDFIANVTTCADQGAPPTDAACPPRDRDARYAPDLNDGVVVNSAALWPLLLPQWKDPRKWWKELATANGRRDYDWSHLAMRYWPERVDRKCHDDPSLGVAHGCFWRYHPARAWAWELRLQEEIGPDFRIEEPPYPWGDDEDAGDAAHRAAYLRDHPDEALAAVEKEALRRRGRGKDTTAVPELTLLEPGLWSARPAECWALETRITEKQEAPFRLRAPDEPQARAAYAAAHPARVADRREQEAQLDAPTLLEPAQ